MVACEEQIAQFCLGGGFLRLMKVHGRESYMSRRSCITFLIGDEREQKLCRVGCIKLPNQPNNWMI